MTTLPDAPSPAPSPGLHGLRLCVFESRKGAELRSLIERQGGLVTVAPSMREIPLEENPAAFAFAEEILAERIDLVLFLTGVGARGLLEIIETRYPRDAFLHSLLRCTLIVRGPKPAAVLREWKVRIDHQVPEPNTWRELLTLLDDKAPVAGKRVAVQEYGKPNREFYAALTARGADVREVPVYRWALPEDLGPLKQAIRSTVEGKFDILLFTSAQQAHHVLEVAAAEGLEDAWRAAARRCLIGSIGPTATETLQSLGLPPDIEPVHPKMGHLVIACANQAAEKLAVKRGE